MDVTNVCLVCNTKLIAPPHKVCLSCYNKAKNIYISPKEYFEKGQEKQRIQWLNDGKVLVPEVIERNITFLMKSEKERWDRIVGDGLSAVFVMIEAIDDMEPTTSFHCRRIAFMCDLIKCLDAKLFAPATKEQVESFMESTTDFWNGKISEDERLHVQKEFEKVMPDATPNDWNAKSIVHWMIHLQNYFDWMWYQWFESVYDSIPDELPDDVWINLFKKHFADVITQWVSVTKE